MTKIGQIYLYTSVFLLLVALFVSLSHALLKYGYHDLNPFTRLIEGCQERCLQTISLVAALLLMASVILYGAMSGYFNLKKTDQHRLIPARQRYPVFAMQWRWLPCLFLLGDVLGALSSMVAFFKHVPSYCFFLTYIQPYAVPLIIISSAILLLLIYRHHAHQGKSSMLDIPSVECVATSLKVENLFHQSQGLSASSEQTNLQDVKEQRQPGA